MVEPECARAGQEDLDGAEQQEGQQQPAVTGQGSAPQAELFLSRDGAKTWVSAGTAGLGAMGHYGDRTVWTQLGQARIDRLVFEVVITDPVKRVLGPGAWVKATPGRTA